MTSSKDYDLISLGPLISPAYQGVANCFSKGPDSKYLSFAYSVVSVTTVIERTKATMDRASLAAQWIDSRHRFNPWSGKIPHA